MFAGALAWPGWARSGREESSALGSLLAYGPRYRAALAEAGRDLVLPSTPADLAIRERLKGTATTDFGAPGVAPSPDARPIDDEELERQIGLLRACWGTFDSAARAAEGKVLRKGPRGGGRELAGIRRHVVEADAGYLVALGARSHGVRHLDLADSPTLREAIVAALRAAPRSGHPPPGPRGGARWTARYFVRRAAWHALDHAWEIEDRTVG